MYLALGPYKMENGSIYHGQRKNGNLQRHGYGKIKYSDGGEYTGDWINNKQ